MTNIHPFLSLAPATASTNREAPSAQAKVDLRSVPSLNPVTNLDIDITEACNLGCVYCFKSELYGQFMSYATLQSTFDWLLAASWNATHVNCNFMGGEPTLRWKDIARFVPWARRRASQRGKTVGFSMTSNLTLWNDEIRKFVDIYGFGILMSIDGCPEVQDAQRPAKNGQRVSATVEKWAKSMLETRPLSTARSTVHPLFVHRLFDSFKYLHAIGFHEVTFAASDYEQWTDAAFEAAKEQSLLIVDYIVDRVKRGERISVTAWNYLLKKLVQPRKVGTKEEIQYLHSPCGAGKGYMMVDYVGDVWPCHRFDGADTDAGAQGAFRLGNIFEPGFHTSLQAAFLAFDHATMQKPACRTCPVEPACGGYCPAANLSDTGSIYTPHDGYCTWSQLSYDMAEYLYEKAASQGCLETVLKYASGTESDGR